MLTIAVFFFSHWATAAEKGDDRLSDTHADPHENISHNGSSGFGGNADSAETADLRPCPPNARIAAPSFRGLLGTFPRREPSFFSKNVSYEGSRDPARPPFLDRYSGGVLVVAVNFSRFQIQGFSRQ
jgi:hypothetical protein